MKKDLGYFLGFQSGQQLGSIPTLTFDDLDQESFLQGIKDGMVRKPAKDQEQLKPSLDAFQKQIDERISAKAKANLEASKKFMEENGKKGRRHYNEVRPPVQDCEQGRRRKNLMKRSSRTPCSR